MSEGIQLCIVEPLAIRRLTYSPWAKVSALKSASDWFLSLFDQQALDL